MYDRSETEEKKILKKVIIVDDEESIRLGLPYIIDWKELGYEIVATGENGEVGLELIRMYKPDVVIADIRMPGKTGLEMVQDALKEGLHFYPIILSGYSDFSYAQQAIRLGAVSYLLKPVDEEELMEVLKSTRSAIASNSQKSLKTMLMEKVFGDDSSGISEYKQIQMLSLEEDTDIAKLSESLESAGMKVCSMIYRHNLIVFLLSNDMQNAAQIEEKWANAFPDKSIICSRWLEANKNLQPLFVDIQTLKKLKFLFPNQLLSGRIIQLINKQKIVNGNVLNDILDALLKSEELHEKLVAYADKFRHDLSLEEDIKWQVNANVNWLVDQVKEKASISIEWDTQVLHEKIYLAQSFPELMKFLEEHLQELSDYLAEALNNLDIIDIIIKYTKVNYNENMTLKSIGDRFSYSSSYLGKKFRRETGKNYLNFLEEVRMEKAGEILRHSNLMVYEVAEKVGYTNVDYFYKKFKQYYQESPNEFRKR